MTGNGETDRSFFSKNEPHHVDAKANAKEPTLVQEIRFFTLHLRHSQKIQPGQEMSPDLKSVSDQVAILAAKIDRKTVYMQEIHMQHTQQDSAPHVFYRLL